MSAIAGIWRFDGKQQSEADCAHILAAQHIYRLLPEDVYDRANHCTAAMAV